MRDTEIINISHGGSFMPREQKISPEEKVELVRRCLEGEASISSSAREKGVCFATIKRWIAQYEMEGAAAFLPREHNRIYDPDVKLQAVQDYLAGGGSQLAICKKYKIHKPSLLESWIKVYNARGNFYSTKHSGGGSYMTQRRSTTQEERIQIVKGCIESGKNYGETAKKYNVSYQQVRSWVLRFEELGEAGLEDRRGKRKKDQAPRTELEQAQIEIEQLKHKLYLAEMENRLLKKLDEVERRDAFRK